MSWANVEIVRDGLLWCFGVNRKQEIDQIFLLSSRLPVVKNTGFAACKRYELNASVGTLLGPIRQVPIIKNVLEFIQLAFVFVAQP
jgi:hypothetical protein